jgi:hypothetical protein
VDHASGVGHSLIGALVDAAGDLTMFLSLASLQILGFFYVMDGYLELRSAWDGQRRGAGLSKVL